MATNLNAFKTYEKDCILSKLSIFFFCKLHWVMYRIDKKIKKFDNMGTNSFRKIHKKNNTLK